MPNRFFSAGSHRWSPFSLGSYPTFVYYWSLQMHDDQVDHAPDAPLRSLAVEAQEMLLLFALWLVFMFVFPRVSAAATKGLTMWRDYAHWQLMVLVSLAIVMSCFSDHLSAFLLWTISYATFVRLRICYAASCLRSTPVEERRALAKMSLAFKGLFVAAIVSLSMLSTHAVCLVRALVL